MSNSKTTTDTRFIFDPPAFVIVTGQKGTGKSTVCRELAADIEGQGGTVVVHRGQRPKDWPGVPRDAFFWITAREEAAFATSLLRLGGIIIFDRWMCTDLVHNTLEFKHIAKLAGEVLRIKGSHGGRLRVYVVDVTANQADICTRLTDRDGRPPRTTPEERNALGRTYTMAAAAVAGMVDGRYVQVQNTSEVERQNAVRWLARELWGVTPPSGDLPPRSSSLEQVAVRRRDDD